MEYAFLITVLAVVVIVLAIASFTNFELDSVHYDRLKFVVINWSSSACLSRHSTSPTALKQ